MLKDNIKKTRLARDLTLQEVADAVGVSRQTIQRYESGIIGNIPSDKIEKIAEVLNVSPADLMGWTGDITEQAPVSDYYFVPEPISAGMPIEIGAMEQLPTVSIPDCMLGKYAHSRHILIMPINGESMNKIIPNNSYIAVNTDISADDLKDGDIVVFAVNGDYAVKQFYDGGDVYIFRPASHDIAFRDCVVAKENADTIKVIGKVVMYNILLD